MLPHTLLWLSQQRHDGSCWCYYRYHIYLHCTKWDSKTQAGRRSPSYRDGWGWHRHPHFWQMPWYYDTTVSILMMQMAWVWGRVGTILSGPVCLLTRSARHSPLSGSRTPLIYVFTKQRLPKSALPPPLLGQWWATSRPQRRAWPLLSLLFTWLAETEKRKLRSRENQRHSCPGLFGASRPTRP